MIYLDCPDWLISITDREMFHTCPTVGATVGAFMVCVYVPAYIHVFLLIWQKWKALCYLLIRFRAQRVWSLSHDNLPDLYQTCRKTEQPEPSHKQQMHRSQITKVEWQQPKRHSEQFPLLEKIVCVVVSDMYTHKSVRMHVAPNTRAIGVEVFWLADLIYRAQTLSDIWGFKDAPEQIPRSQINCNMPIL